MVTLNNNRRRDRLEVIYDFLKVVETHQGSIKKTPLLRKANLSSRSFIEYFNELISKEFIREIVNKNNKFIVLTDKGYNYLNKYSQFYGFLKDFGL